MAPHSVLLPDSMVKAPFAGIGGLDVKVCTAMAPEIVITQILLYVSSDASDSVEADVQKVHALAGQSHICKSHGIQNRRHIQKAANIDQAEAGCLVHPLVSSCAVTDPLGKAKT
ncbi:uncharacterized protein LOC144124836 [Amblyomma americanum]